MPPRQQRNEAFFAPASGEQALQKMLIAARETGQCNLRGRQLTELPSACLDINSVVLPEGGAPPRGRSGHSPHVTATAPHTHTEHWCGVAAAKTRRHTPTEHSVMWRLRAHAVHGSAHADHVRLFPRRRVVGLPRDAREARREPERAERAARADLAARAARAAAQPQPTAAAAQPGSLSL
eukprot:scaffold80755_cov61-Phaeocystis_antarctica.AAC.2